MRNKNVFFKILTITSLVLISFAFTSGDGGKKTTFKGNLYAGDSYRFFINNIEMPMNWEGVLADVSIDGREGGRIGDNTFLYSGGFLLSGTTNGTPWANGVASASRIQDYERGTYEFGTNDSRNGIYVLKQSDGDFADSWIKWKDAVALGAYYYDGDGDGQYNPVDLNRNGKWDPTEDRPDLIGDATAWLVIKDSQRPALRRFNDVTPQGIEIRQSVFGFASKGIAGNMIFVRYSILNTGSIADTIDNVYFGVWADADIGGSVGYTDDLVGCDTTLNVGFTYNDGDDPQWGATPPCFIIDFFQGPIAYVPGVSFDDKNRNNVYDEGDTPLDTAQNVQGQVRGVVKYPGALNLGLSSFVQYIQSHPTQGDPATQFEARNYMLGFDKNGNSVDPATWPFGGVFQNGVQLTDSATIANLGINPKFMYSGDPVTKNGWLNISPDDQRQMSNTGPFKLIKGQPVDIVAAYVVGIGQSATNSVTVAKDYDQVAQLLFDSNFPTLPSPPPISFSVKNGSNFIDITWDTYKQANYSAVDTVLGIDRRLQGFYVTAFKTRSKVDLVSGQANRKVIADYQIDNFIKSVYQKAPNGGQNLIIKEASASNRLNPAIYSDSTTGRIRLRIERDPFTNEPLVKGHEYYFAITQYYLNHMAIVPRSGGNYGVVGDYYDPLGNGYEEFETPLISVTFGEDQYSPAYRGYPANRLSGVSDGDIKILPVDYQSLTGDEYTVEFFEDKAQAPGTPYLPYWRIKNNRTNETLIDSSKVYDFDTTKVAGKVVDGFLVKVKPVQAEIGLEQTTYTPASNKWYTSFRPDSATGVFYVGKDLPQSGRPTIGGISTQSNYTRANRLRTIEIRFGTQGKAYRYLNGFKATGAPVTRRSTYIYAPYIFAADTNGSGIQKFGEGYVDVPFTAWVKDDRYGEEYQLAVGFVELSKTLNGNPDGIWDPGNVTSPLGNEAIIIFDAPYDPNGNQVVYTGGSGTYSGTNWPDVIKGYTLNDPNATDDQKAQAQSQLFNALYVVSLKKNANGDFYQPGDVLTIPMEVYPYTSADKFTFKTIAKGELTEDQQKALFDKVNVFPNPLFGFNPATSYDPSNSPDEPFVTFSNLPEDVTIKIFTLGGTLVRTLNTSDKSSPSSTFLRWNLKNEDGLRVASGLYIAIVSSPKFGDKILKFSVILPQKQIQQY